MPGLIAFSRSGRTRLVVAAVLLSVATFLFVQGALAPRVRSTAPRPVPRFGNPIVAENKKPGTDSWHITDDTGHGLQGYASKTSVGPHGHITLYVTSKFPTY